MRVGGQARLVVFDNHGNIIRENSLQVESFVCQVEQFLTVESDHVTIYTGAETEILPPLPPHFGAAVESFVQVEGTWFISAKNIHQETIICSGQEWTCSSSLCSDIPSFNLGSRFIFDFLIIATTAQGMPRFCIIDPRDLNSTTISVVGFTNSQTNGMTAGSSGSFLSGGMYGAVNQGQTYYGLVIYLNGTHVPILPSDGNDQKLNLIYQVEDEVYFTVGTVGYMSKMSGQPRLLNQFEGAAVLNFFPAAIASMPIIAVKDTFGFIMKIILSVIALILIAIVITYTYVSKSKVEYVKVTSPLDDKFTDESSSRGRIIAKGSFGTVAMVRHSNGGLYAAKYIDIQQAQLEELALQEVQILKTLQHRNTIRLRDFSRSQNQIVIYTDLFDGVVSDLYLKRVFSLSEIRIIATGMALGLQYVHSLKIAHRDIKVKSS